MRVLLCCTLAALLATCCGLSADDKKDGKIDVKKLIGKWEPKEKKDGHSAVIEFMKGGKVSAVISGDGKEAKIDGTYKVEGDKLIVTIKFGDMDVSKKGMHQSGDKLVYCEIDSLLPERPEFEFLRASSFKPAQTDAAGATILPAGFRIRTVKLRGQVSQGICFPLSVLPPGAPAEEGADVTGLLGVRKWEPPLPVGMGGKVKGGFPGFIPKTDETRVQVLEAALQRHKGKTFYVTEKLDGTSFTAFLRQGEFGICSRNLWMDEADESNVLVRVAKRLRLEEKLRAARDRFGHDIAVQAEVIGPGIQKNKYGLREVTLRVFNVLNVDTYRLLDHPAKLAVLTELELQPVPQLGTLVLNHTVDELVTLSEGTSVLNPQVQREGVVLRPLVEEYDEDIGGRLSFKAINPKFLLKYDE